MLDTATKLAPPFLYGREDYRRHQAGNDAAAPHWTRASGENGIISGRVLFVGRNSDSRLLHSRFFLKTDNQNNPLRGDMRVTKNRPKLSVNRRL